MRRWRDSSIHAGKYKVEGNPDEPLDKEARAEMQRHVDRYYRMFVESVARNRNTTSVRVEAEFGRGRIAGAADAVRKGMGDGVGTIEEVTRNLSGRLASQTLLAVRRRKVALHRH